MTNPTPSAAAAARVPLTKGQFALIDENDLPLISQYRWAAVPHRGKWRAYAYVKNHLRTATNRRMISMHGLIANPPAGYVVDHINRNPLDNRRCNLRICTQAQNQRNSKVKKRVYIGCAFRGVRSDKKKWRAEIEFEGVRFNLGNFNTPEQAALAYNNAAIAYHGEFASLNVLELRAVHSGGSTGQAKEGGAS